MPRTYQMQSTSANSSAAGLMIAEVRALLPVVEEVAEGSAAESTRLLATADPDPHLEPVTRLGDGRQDVRVLLAPAQQVVRR